MITRDDVLAAQQRIHGRRVRRTPGIAVDPGTSNLWLKCEFLQLAGVFKTRGAFNRILAGLETRTLDPARGIVTASGGNAGLANAYAAAQVGVPATVFVPETAPAVKVARLRKYGAAVQQVGREYAEAYAAAIEFSDHAGALFCHAYDQPEIAAGAGTIGEEILTDIPDVDTIVVAVGGGGLFAGIAAAAEGRARVVAVEPVLIPTLHAALQGRAARRHPRLWSRRRRPRRETHRQHRLQRRPAHRPRQRPRRRRRHHHRPLSPVAELPHGGRARRRRRVRRTHQRRLPARTR